MTGSKKLSRRWVVKSVFEGVPKKEDFELVEELLPDDLGEGEIYVEALYLSVDPYMRPFTSGMEPPFTMIGESVYRVVDSKVPDYPVGSLACAKAGWVASGILKVLSIKLWVKPVLHHTTNF